MTGSKLWHKNTEIKNTKVAKMLELIKTCHQYPFCWGENRFSQYAVRVKWVISYCLEESLAWRNKQKWRDSIFLFTNVSSSYLNTINLKLFHVPCEDSGNAGAKKVLDALENDTKTNFQKNIPCKIRIQEKWGSMTLCPCRQPWLVGYMHKYEKNFEKYTGDIESLGVHRNMRGCNFDLKD